VARARLNLDYATIRAPIDGIVGAAHVSEGALVVQNDSTSLATIQQLDPIYADFTQSVTEMHQLRRALDTGELDPHRARCREGAPRTRRRRALSAAGQAPVLRGQGRCPYRAVTLRGEFPNPKRELLPGMYVRVQIEQGIDSDAIAVPQQAIQRNSGGGSEVFVVRDDSRVTIQPVRPDRCRTASGSSPTA